jgi:hypothetical protein
MHSEACALPNELHLLQRQQCVAVCHLSELAGAALHGKRSRYYRRMEISKWVVFFFLFLCLCDFFKQFSLLFVYCLFLQILQSNHAAELIAKQFDP